MFFFVKILFIYIMIYMYNIIELCYNDKYFWMEFNL